MDSLTEEFQKRQSEKPDRWTIAWLRDQFAEVFKQFRGVNHNLNRLGAEVSELYESDKALRERCSSLEAERDAANAKIGELQAEFIDVKERLERHAAFLAEIRDERKKRSA